MRQSASTKPRPAELREYIPVALPRRRRAPKLVIVEPLSAPPRGRRSERGERMLTVVPIFMGEEQKPMIRIRGSWLEQLGFTIGARIVVSEEHGRIVLTVGREE